MALQDFGKALAGIVERSGNAWFEDDITAPATPVWVSLGVCKNIQWTLEAVETEADSTGRIHQTSYNFEVQIVLMQTRYGTEFANLSLLQQPSTNGLTFKLTDRPNDGTTVATADGVSFENVVPRLSAEVDFNGAESMITLMFSGRVPLDEFDAFTTTGGTVTIDG